MKIIKIIGGIIFTAIILVALAGVYKFNYLANQPGYDVDGNKIENPESLVVGTLSDEMIAIMQQNNINQINSLDNEMMVVNIASWDLDESVNFQEYIIPQTPGVLDASLQKLFAIEGDENAIYNGLSYVDVILDNSIARIFLEGDFIPVGDFSGVYMRNNINQTAFQFDTVNVVEVYMNNEFFDWCIDSQAEPSESSCDVSPKYWIDSKQ